MKKKTKKLVGAGLSAALCGMILCAGIPAATAVTAEEPFMTENEEDTSNLPSGEPELMTDSEEDTSNLPSGEPELMTDSEEDTSNLPSGEPEFATDSEEDTSNLLSRELEMTYSSRLDSGLAFMTTMDVRSLLNEPLDGFLYTAAVADPEIAEAVTNEDGSQTIYARGVGSTKADIYEQDGSHSSLVGTITIDVTEMTMAEAGESIFYSWYAENPLKDISLNPNLGRDSVDIKELFHKAFVGNPDLGSHFQESDYTLTVDPVETEAGKVADGVAMAGDHNGLINVDFSVAYTDGSVLSKTIYIKVAGLSLETVEGYTLDNIRDYVIGLDTPVQLEDGSETAMINFDNAATTPALKAVKDAIDEELLMYGSIGRGFSQKSNHSTDVYNSTRDKVLDFLKADPDLYTCFYVNSTTDGLNKLASALVESEDDIVLTTRIEHHANDLSWRERCNVIYAEVDDQGRVIYDDIERLLQENDVSIVSISAASNVTGYVNDVHRVARLAHQYGAKIVVDGAQIVAHRQFSMIGDTPEENIDFFAFSAHKMYSPYGGGAVVGLKEELDSHMPEFYGGGIIEVVGDDWQIYKKAPEAYEAGSPNYPGVVGLGKALDILHTVGMDNIEAHEKVLNRKLIDGLKELDNVILYGDTENIEDRVGVVTFNFTDINSYCISQQLSLKGGVATRRGAFCAHPYVWRLMGISDEAAKDFEGCASAKTAGMVRVSFGIYNTEEEVDRFLELMPQVMEKAKELTYSTDTVPEY